MEKFCIICGIGAAYQWRDLKEDTGSGEVAEDVGLEIPQQLETMIDVGQIRRRYALLDHHRGNLFFAHSVLLVLP